VTGSSAYTLHVDLAPLTFGSDPSAATVGQAYNQTLSVTNGTGPYSFSQSGGSIPAGLTLNSDGSITGTPTREARRGCLYGRRDRLPRRGGLESIHARRECATINVGPASLSTGTVGTSTAPRSRQMGSRRPTRSLWSAQQPSSRPRPCIDGSINGSLSGGKLCTLPCSRLPIDRSIGCKVEAGGRLLPLTREKCRAPCPICRRSWRCRTSRQSRCLAMPALR